LKRILLTNDDGIYAKGIEALFKEMKKDYDVTVVAPETEQSAVGHAITLMNPLRLKTVKRNREFFGYAIDGTPADCVKLAIMELMKPRPDLLLSGINLGANVGINVIYSGTVSAATEGTMMGIPSMAISIDSFGEPDFTGAARIARFLVQKIFEKGLPAGTSLNVNVPAIPMGEIKGFALTKQGTSRFHEKFDRRLDPRNNIYYWLGGATWDRNTHADTDAGALAKKMVSITPIKHDLTNYHALDELKKWDISHKPA